jgi:hypothetical protein
MVRNHLGEPVGSQDTLRSTHETGKRRGPVLQLQRHGEDFEGISKRLMISNASPCVAGKVGIGRKIALSRLESCLRPVGSPNVLDDHARRTCWTLSA